MKKIILAFSVAGLLFAGYLSAIKLFNNTCAFGETCPYFLGYPACYYGFVLYALLTILGAFLVWERIEEKKILNAVLGVSFLGILFAGYYTLGELPLLFERGFSAYFFGLPTCALGLIFYVAIFVLSLVERFSKKELI